ncbi:MAG: hypothetical protein ACRDST_19670 [Pseudonocardiaceae bacterium]
MSSSNKDIDEAAEPFMEQAKEALGDVTGDEDLENPGKPLGSVRRGEMIGAATPTNDMP